MKSLTLVNQKNQERFDLMEPQRWTSPVVNYWWYRKQYEVTKLLNRNIELFSQQTNVGSQAPLFLDIGCGEGRDLFIYQRLFNKKCPGWRFLGIDAPMNLDKFMKNKNEFKTDNIDFVGHNLNKTLPLKDNEVDVVYCSEVIEHILEPQILLNEIKRVLKPNGYFILTTPNEPNVFQRSYWNQNRRKKMLEEIEKLKLKENNFQTKINGEEVTIYGHISVKTIQEWEAILHEMGFETVDYGRGSATYGASQIFDNRWILVSFFLFEALLDTFPRRWVRYLSSQIIGLYKLAK